MADEKIMTLLHTGSEVVSAVVGAGFGLIFPTTAGVLAAGALAPLAEASIKKVLGDVADRQLSDRERSKVGTAAAHALNRIYERWVAGDRPRQDGFFESLNDQRSPAETVLEGVLMESRLQWEEKKIPWIANIYVNAAFTDVPPEVVNRAIVLADRLTWRQFCLTALAGRHEELGIHARWMTHPPAEMSKAQTVLLGEVNDLFGGQFGFLKTNPVGLTVMGQATFDLMSFKDFPQADLEAVASLFPLPPYAVSASHEEREYDQS
ncbi:hypothetical protein P12x_005321 [Tundrisphaera lichenicola]|uniref:hypothetical protein n=1 Tax=Tundrisphaera lichenicola TaxID=2029860 RepID=UPI003EBA93CF